MSVAGGLLGVGLAALLTSAMGSGCDQRLGLAHPLPAGGPVRPGRPCGCGRKWKKRPPSAKPRPRATLPPGGFHLRPRHCRAFGFTILWTVAFYVFLTYMPTYTRTQLHLTAAQSLWASTASLLALVVLVPLMGALSDRIGRKKLLLTSCALCFVISDPGVLCADRGIWICQRRPDPDRLRLRDLAVLRRQAIGDRRDLPDPQPFHLDVVVLRPGSGDFRRIRSVHLAVADRCDGVENGPHRLRHGCRGDQLRHHRHGLRETAHQP